MTSIRTAFSISRSRRAAAARPSDGILVRRQWFRTRSITPRRQAGQILDREFRFGNRLHDRIESVKILRGPRFGYRQRPGGDRLSGRYRAPGPSWESERKVRAGAKPHRLQSHRTGRGQHRRFPRIPRRAGCPVPNLYSVWRDGVNSSPGISAVGTPIRSIASFSAILEAIGTERTKLDYFRFTPGGYTPVGFRISGNRRHRTEDKGFRGFRLQIRDGHRSVAIPLTR